MGGGGPLGNYRIKLDAYSNMYLFLFLKLETLCHIVCSKKKKVFIVSAGWRRHRRQSAG
jgi:hypothetical protein